MKKTLLAAVAALSLASFGDIRAVTPDMYGGNAKAWQVARHNQFMEKVKAGGAPVVFIGDSITHFWETSGKAQWEKYFSHGALRALNLGISADRTEHLLWRLGAGGELDGYKAKCIVLMIGTNNTGHFDETKETPIDTICGVRKVLDLIAEKQPTARTILCSIFPRGADDTDGFRRRNDVVNKELANFADGKKVIWCDFSDKFLDANGRLSPELFPDRLHPNARGYEIWASAVIPLIHRVLRARPETVIPSVWPSSPRGYSLEGCAALRASSAFNQIPWWNKGILLDQRNATAAVNGGTFDVVWVGDSITHRWYREGGEGRALWQKLAGTYSMLNLGIGGDRTEHVLWRLRNGELEGYRAKMFAVMIGTNNGGRDVRGVAAAVKEIVALIAKKHPEAKIVLMPIFPRGDNLKGHAGNVKINEIIKGCADGANVRWLDFNAQFLNAEGKLTKTVMNDLLHPNEKGYEIWWNAIAPTVKEIVGK